MSRADECKCLLSYREDQAKIVKKYRAKRQLSSLFQLMLDALEEGQADWVERFKKKVEEQIDAFQVKTITEKES